MCSFHHASALPLAPTELFLSPDPPGPLDIFCAFPGRAFRRRSFHSLALKHLYDSSVRLDTVHGDRTAQPRRQRHLSLEDVHLKNSKKVAASHE